MKIAGLKPLKDYRSVCQLPRPNGDCLALTMQPLSLGFSQRLRDRGLAAPAAPQRIARDSSGRPVRDESGLAVMVADEQNADHARLTELYHQRVAVLAVAESLKADVSVEFAAREPAGDDGWDSYADAMYAEMEEAGLTAGDLLHLCSFVCRMSNLGSDHLRQAESSFSQASKEGPG